MAYATTDNLLDGKLTFGSILMPPSVTSNTNHMAVFDFNGKTYFVYHNGTLPGGSGFRRTPCIAEVHFNEDGSVQAIPETAAGIHGAGLQTLNGTQAVAYARIRYVGNADFERTSRQREVLRKVFDKALDMNPLQYPEFARKFLPTVETSLDLGDILSLADVMLKKPALEDVRFPTNADLIGNGSITVNGENCLNLDLESTSEKLHAFIYEDIDPTTDADRRSNGQKASDGASN